MNDRDQLHSFKSRRSSSRKDEEGFLAGSNKKNSDAQKLKSGSSRASERFSKGERSDSGRFSKGVRTSGRTYRSAKDGYQEGDYSERRRQRRESSFDSSRRNRASSSRPSRGRASDRVRYANGRDRFDYEYDSRAYKEHRDRYSRNSYEEERYGYGRHAYYDEYDERDTRSARRRQRGSHSDVYVRSGNNRGVFNRGFSSLPFGLDNFGIGNSSGFGNRYYGSRMGGGASGLSALPLPVAYAIPVAVLVLIIALLIFAISSVQACTASDQEEQVEVEEVQPMNLSYQASVSGIDAIADPGTTITGFTLANEGQNYLPTLSEEGLNSIQTALQPFVENEYDVGFVMMDLQTGSGYVYNPDVEVYGASSFKGPVLIYGCQESLEPGILSIDTVNDVSSNAIIYSDNKSYYSMRAFFEGYSEIGLVNWLANLGLDSSLETDSSFPHYSARESAKLWMNTYLYFTSADSDPEIVSWAEDLFSRTEVSMMRAGVDPTFPLVLDSGEVYINQADQNDQSTDQNGENTEESSGDQRETQSDQDQSGEQSQGLSAADMTDSSSDLIVYDKAGWINGETDDGLCDAGIIYDGDNAYLLCIMTGTPDSDDARQDFARLVSALWGQRSALAPSQGYVLVDPTTSADQSGQA